MNEFIPSEFYLAQNYPNPFKGKTIIKYCIAYKTRVKLTVYNSEGDVIAKLVDEEKKPGAYEVEFSAANCHSSESGNLTQGNYFFRLEVGDYRNEKKMEIEK